MKKYVLLTSLLSLGACALHIDTEPGSNRLKNVSFDVLGLTSVQGDGVLSQQTRQLPSFNALEARGPLDVDIRFGPTQSVIVQADSNLQGLIETSAAGGTLVIRTTANFRSHLPLKVSVVVPVLSRVANAGTGKMTIDGLNAETFDFSNSGTGKAELVGRAGQLQLSISGTGDVTSRDLQADRLTLKMHGTGDARLAGHIGDLTFNQKGTGDLQLDGLDGSADLSVHGTGNAQIGGKVASLEVQKSGSGNLALDGLNGGKVNIKGNGTGNIQLRGHTGAVKLEMAGSTDLRAEGLDVTDVEVVLHGTGSARLGTVKAERFQARLSGSGNLTAHGQARSVDLAVSGTGDAMLTQLSADDARLQASGSGAIRTTVRNSVWANAKGSGTITIDGQPLQRDVTGKVKFTS